MGCAAQRRVGSSQTRDWTCVLCVGRQILYHWTTREVLGWHLNSNMNSKASSINLINSVQVPDGAFSPQTWYSFLLFNSFLTNSSGTILLGHQFSSVAQSCPTLCDPMDCSTPGLPVHHQLPEFTQTHVHWVSYAIQPSHPLSSPSPPTFKLP